MPINHMIQFNTSHLVLSLFGLVCLLTCTNKVFPQEKSSELDNGKPVATFRGENLSFGETLQDIKNKKGYSYIHAKSLIAKAKHKLLLDAIRNHNITVTEEEVLKQYRKLAKKRNASLSEGSKKFQKTVTRAIKGLMNNSNMTNNKVFKKYLKPAGINRNAIKMIRNIVSIYKEKNTGQSVEKKEEHSPTPNNIEFMILKKKLKRFFTKGVTLSNKEIDKIKLLIFSKVHANFKLFLSKERNSLANLGDKTEYKKNNVKVVSFSFSSISPPNPLFSNIDNFKKYTVLRFLISNAKFTKGSKSNVLFLPERDLYAVIKLNGFPNNIQSVGNKLTDESTRQLQEELLMFKEKLKFKAWVYHNIWNNLKVIDNNLKSVFKGYKNKLRKNYILAISQKNQKETSGAQKKLKRAILEHDYQKMLKLLDQNNIELNQVVGATGKTPLMLAAYSGNKLAVTELLKRGAKINQEVRSGKTVLMVSSETGRLEISKTLIKNGANVNGKDDDGWTPLTYAVYLEHPKIVRLLINNGAKIGAQTTDGKNIYQIAKEASNAKIVNMLKNNR